MTTDETRVGPRGGRPNTESKIYTICKILVFFVAVLPRTEARDLIKEGCRLNVQAMPGKNTPLLLEGNGRITAARGVPWLLPTKFGEDDVLSLAPDEEITIACPGQRYNVVTNIGVPSTTAVCPRPQPGSPVVLEVVQIPKGIELKEDQFACDRPAQAEMKREGGTCGRTGRWFQLGFNVTGIGWLPLLGSCVDSHTGAALYVESEIHGRGIEAAQKEARRPSTFAKGIAELYDGYDPEEAYKKVAQQNTLAHILGSVSMASDVLSVSGLVRGHLSPDGDHLWAPHQWATYFYANVAPQWETINGGHWKVVENLARKIAGQTGKDLKIYTGTHGILKMLNKDGKKVPIYLVPSLKKIPVPEHFWKVIYDPSTQAGIALVAANNPSLTRREMGGALPCTDVCALHGWPTDLRKDVKKGLVTCCTVGQLRAAGFALPASVRAKRILRGPRKRTH